MRFGKWILVGAFILMGADDRVAGQTPLPLWEMDGEETRGKQGQVELVPGVNGNALSFLGGVRPAFLKADTLPGLSFHGNQSFTVSLWIKTSAVSYHYPAIITNKDWSSGDIRDFTTIHYLGFSRTSGADKGWAIAMKPDGAWSWNIGNGESRLDYHATRQRQRINDGQWHHLAFSINQPQEEARLYFDGVNVAIYHIGNSMDLQSDLPVCIGDDVQAKESSRSFEGTVDEVSIYDQALTDAQVGDLYCTYRARPEHELKRDPVRELDLMAWNIWHGGRHPGRQTGPQQVIDFIRHTNVDIIMMQETYGSGPIIADALGYYFYLASPNLSVMSRFPIHETWVVHGPSNCGVATIELSPTQRITVSSLWLHYLPAWRRDARAEGATAEKLIAGEETTRHREIKDILELLKPQIDNAGKVPIIIGGDYNSPSYRDWTEATRGWHNGLVVKWPVSWEMDQARFTDAFRAVHPDLNYASNTMTAERLSFRIDYINFKGQGLKVIESDMYYSYLDTWPSDHPAVTAKIRLE